MAVYYGKPSWFAPTVIGEVLSVLRYDERTFQPEWGSNLRSPTFQAGSFNCTRANALWIYNHQIMSPLAQPGEVPFQQTRYFDPMLDQCWAGVVDGGQTLAQHWVHFPRFPGYVPCHFSDRLQSKINIQPDPKKKCKKTFLVFLISISPDEVHVKSFSKFDRGKGLQDEFSKWSPNASICTNVLYKLLF